MIHKWIIIHIFLKEMYGTNTVGSTLCKMWIQLPIHPSFCILGIWIFRSNSSFSVDN